MKFPNRDKTYIPPSKLTEYLLSETHTVGKAKAKFFQGLGFNETNPRVLEQSLLAIAYTGTIVEVVSSPHGTKYVVDGSLETPSGVVVEVRTVWIIEVEEDRPRFVTAYPA